MKIEELKKYKKILILGYGIEGKATHEFLKKFVPDSEIGIADQKDDQDYLVKQADYDLVIKSPGIPKRLVTRPYTTATNIFFANAKAPIIGITGTKGKSTTTTLIYSILKEAGYDARLIGNIGVPMLSELTKGDEEKEIYSLNFSEGKLGKVYVCELSSYQLDDIEHSPHIAVIISLFPEHLDYHGSLEEYKKAKFRIVAHSKDYFVYNPNYPELVQLAEQTKAKNIPFIAELPFPRDIVPLMGEHNVENVRGVVTVAQILEIPMEIIERAIKKFKPLSHRLEVVGTFKGISFYNDAISTTPESTIQALEAIPNIDTIFLGGKDRGYDFTVLAKKVIEKKVRNIVLFPDSGAKIKEELLKLGGKFNFFETRDMEAAVKFAYENTANGLNCILSCASPSYSIWKNFEEKGDLFKKFVRQLGT